MLEFIDTRDDVLAVTISGKIAADELAATMDRLEQALERHDTVHVFVETRGLEGIEVAGLARHIRRALPLFRSLDRFGRVAVVADQDWVRTATKIESAVLPGISYLTFEPAHRDVALAWVQDVPARQAQESKS